MTAYFGSALTDAQLQTQINDRNDRPYTFLQYLLVISTSSLDGEELEMLAFVSDCLDMGADVDKRDEWGETALFYAMFRPIAFVELICLAGANLEIRNNNGDTCRTKPSTSDHNKRHISVLATYAARDARCTAAIIALLNRRFREAKQLPRDVARIIGRMLWAPKSRRSEVWGE
jgi:hypothetical protein